MARRARVASVRVRTHALLVRRVTVGEADLVVTFLTEARGIVASAARAARKSARRFVGLEPMHLLSVEVDERAGLEMTTLVEASIVRPRLHLVEDLGALEAAGRMLRWVRRLAPPGAPEPALWRCANDLLDALDGPPSGVSPDAMLVQSGLAMLAAIGWGLDLERCVACGRACEPGRAACIDPGRGGLVCQRCGGARTVISAELRRALLEASRGRPAPLASTDAAQALELVEAALAAHVDILE